jgi:hypothetical protein
MSSLGASSRSPRLLEQVRHAIRLRHYSLRTEHAYLGWIKRFILFHDKRHPRDMGAEEVTAFLSQLAVKHEVRHLRKIRRSTRSCFFTERP